MKTRISILLLVAISASFVDEAVAQPALAPDTKFRVTLARPASDWNWVLQHDGKIFVAGGFSFVRSSVRPKLARLLADGQVDPGFSPASVPELVGGVEGLQSGNRPLILNREFWGYRVDGGDPLIRLDASGAVDYTFVAPRITRVLSVLPDDRLIAARLSQGGVEIFRLNPDGNQDTSFPNPVILSGPDGGSYNIDNVPTLAVQPDGKLLLAATFWSGSTITRRYFVRVNLDGTLDPSFAQILGPDGWLLAIVVRPDGRILIGGSFRSVNGRNRLGLAQLDPAGNLDESFPAGMLDAMNPWVTAMALQLDGKLIVIGNVIQAASEFRECVRFHVDGSLDESFKLDTQVVGTELSKLAVQPDGQILLLSQGLIENQLFPKLLRLNPDGKLDSTFEPFSAEAVKDATVKVLAPSGDKLIIGGSFSSVNGHYSPGVARLNADGTVDANFVADPTIPVMWYYSARGSRTFFGDILALPDGKLLLHGVGGPVIRLNSNGALDVNFERVDVGGGFEGWGQRPIIGLQGSGRILLQQITMEPGPEFDGASLRLTRLAPNGSVDGSFAPEFRNSAGMGVGGAVFRLSPGGGGQGIGRIARESPEITALVVQPDDKIVVAGEFTEVNGMARHGIARLNANGSLDASFDAGTTLTDLAETVEIKALAVDATGRILVGGYYFKWRTLPLVLGLVRLNPNGSVDDSFRADPNGVFPGFEDRSRAVDRVRILSDGSLFIALLDGSAALLRSDGFVIEHFFGSGISGELIVSDVHQDAGLGLVFAGSRRESGDDPSPLVRYQLAPIFRQPRAMLASNFKATLGVVAGRLLRIEASADLVNWQTATNVISVSETLQFTDPEAANALRRFYRAVAP